MHSPGSALSTHADAPQGKAKARFITVVWGREHTSALTTLAWRTLLAPGNLPAFLNRYDVTYQLHIAEEDLSIVTESQQFRAMSELLRLEVKTFTPADMHQDRYEWHWAVWRRAVEGAKTEGSIVLLVIPDIVYSDGTLARWADLMASGRRAIFSIGTWVTSETFLADYLQRYPLDRYSAVPISRNEMMEMMLEHMHPLIAASCRESGHAVLHAERLTALVPHQGIVSRIMTSQPFLFDPGHFRLDPTYCPLNRFSDMAVDDVCFLSPGPALHLAQFYQRPAPFDDDRVSHIGGWAFENIRPPHYYESRVDYHYPRQDVTPEPAAWERVSRTLDRTRVHVLSAAVITRVAYWAGEREGHLARTFLAMALMRCGINRTVATDGAFTAFVPWNGAFAEWSEAHIAALYDGGETAPILHVIRDHIVTKRLYLRPGDKVALGPAEAETRFGTTLSGKTVTVTRRCNLAALEAAMIVRRQERIEFGAVYLVDRLLTSPLQGERPILWKGLKEAS